MPAIKTHHTDTSTDSWSGPANKSKVLTDKPASYFAEIYAWRDPVGDQKLKTSYRFIHHFVGEDGTAGVASTVACSAGIAVLNGGRGGTTIPESDRRGVYSHLAAHLRDADMEPPTLKAEPIANHELKECKISIGQVLESGEFDGFASIFGNVDQGGDIVHRGAFQKTILDHNGKVPLLDSHRSPIGVSDIEETTEGLKVHGYLNLDKQAARERYSDLKFYREHGMQMGMSFGFDAVKADQTNGVRNVREVKLYEVTITEFPMNLMARVTAVKQLSKDDKAITFDTALDAAQTWAARYQMCNALIESLDSIAFDSDLSAEDKVNASAESIGTFGEDYTSFLPKLFALMESRYKCKLEAWEEKSGRRISAASRSKLEAAIKEIQALLEEDDTTAKNADSASDDSAAGKSDPPTEPPQPQYEPDIHSLAAKLQKFNPFA